MPDPKYKLRPDVETFEHAGARVTLVDYPQILVAAAGQRVELLHDPVFPPPVRAAGLSITHDVRDGEPVYLLDAVVRSGPGREPRRLTLGALGNDPLSALLTRRVAAGDPWAVRMVDGAGAAVAEVSRRLGLSGPEAVEVPVSDGELIESTVRDDERTGLRTTVTVHSAATEPDGRVVALHAVVPSGTMSAEHLQAFCRIVLDVVVEAIGDTGPATAGQELTGHPVTVSATADVGQHVTLDQVGGLVDIVAQLRQIAVSFRHPQAMARWGARRPQGVFLYGPPGTGKTMLARALAHEIGAEFREIHTPDILDKWLGASERNIKRIFRDARRYHEPTLMLFDEFDTIIGYAGDGQDAASQAINAVAGIFKQEMNDLIDANPNVIVVATTNFPQRVDASLVRSGRFDVKLSVPAPDEVGRAQILAKMIRQLIVEHEVGGFQMFADDLDVEELSARSRGMSGADIKEVLRRAQLSKAMHEARTGSPASAIDQEDLRREIVALHAELGRAAA